MPIVHVVGTGTIGEPLIGLLTNMREDFGLDEVSFHKRTPSTADRATIAALIDRGAKLSVDEESVSDFQKLGHKVSFVAEEAIARADVVIDCTPAGNEHRASYLEIGGPKLYMAQGSENGFGMPYARGINDDALDLNDRFVQIVSCNTHNICILIKKFAATQGDIGLEHGQFVCMRRATDISQAGGYISSPEVAGHPDLRFGTHHAQDAWRIFQTLDQDLSLFSSVVKIPTQYMHTLHFSLTLKEATSREDILMAASEDRRIAVTEKRSSGQVFSFGRDHGYYGRLLCMTVLPTNTLHVTEDGHRVTGFCFTPQDGNALLSSISCMLWYLYEENPAERFKAVRPWTFQEI